MSDRPVVLVTGSATGVGRATIVRFAREGFDVVVNYSRSEAEAQETCDLAQTAGAATDLIRCDVSDTPAVEAMLAQIGERFGKLDVLVNNAGTTFPVPHAKLDEMTEEKWDRILDVNVKAPFFVTRAAVPWLRKGQAAAVVNVSSVAGLAGMGSSIAYCASKGALNTMTKSLARVLAPEIRVNAVCPGPIDTRWLRTWMNEEQIQSFVADYPIPRCAAPEDIADAIFYLARGTSLTTGQLLTVDGGRTM
ncbi:MAG: SDR family oxidoreductase [Planctomycetaceae bacterium]|nr:SDR family oxidoreductase [Planctomycetaceae bacterium]